MRAPRSTLAASPAKKSARPARSWIDKRDACPRARVEVLATAKGANYPPGRMLISSPNAIDAVVREVPAGRVITLGKLRERLARAADADYTCPMTTGIFWRIAAEAAEEERAQGGAAAMPWWRVVRDDGTLIDKAPGGIAGHSARLEAERVALDRSRKVPRVATLEELVVA